MLIATPPWLNLELESRLREEFRLVDAIVAPRRADPQSQREAVARSAAQFLERRLRDGMIVSDTLNHRDGTPAGAGA